MCRYKKGQDSTNDTNGDKVSPLSIHGVALTLVQDHLIREVSAVLWAAVLWCEQQLTFVEMLHKFLKLTFVAFLFIVTEKCK